jgi:chaperonin GroES
MNVAEEAKRALRTDQLTPLLLAEFLCRSENTMSIRPLHDRILVKRLDEEEKTAGGLYIPDTAKEKPIQGKVIAVGAGKRDKEGKAIPVGVKAGEKVLFSKYSGTEVKIEGEEHLIMREDDILAVIE